MAGLGTPQIRELFTQESDVRLAHLGQLLLQLEGSADDETLVRSVFRELHTLKGSAAIAGLAEVSECAHALEELVDDLRTGTRPATADDIDQLLIGVDQLADLIAGGPRDGTEPAATATNAATATLPSSAARPPTTPTSGHPGSPASAGANVEPPPARSGALATANGVSAAPLATIPRRTSPPSEPPGGSVGRRGGATRLPAKAPAGAILVPTERLEELTRLIGQSASAHLRVGRMLKDRFGVDPASNPEYNELSRSLNELQDRATRTQMVPVATITDQLQRAVRDLSRAQGKDVRWDARGTDTEMDRGVLLALSDSLIHLVRNAVDHGIESVADREAAGKPPYGTIRLHAMQLGSEVIIAVTDDGRGIDTAGVSSQAARQGIDTEGLSEEELLGLTFQPGLSTTSFVTDVSGRGVGLDVVRTNVEASRGRVEVRSTLRAGTEFRIIVPITLAVLRCLLIEAGGQRFALPFHRVILTQADEPSACGHAGGRAVIWANDEPVPLSTLSETLGAPAPATPSGGPVVVLADTSRRHAFQVDRLVGQRDVVVKGLSRLLPHLPAVAGASVEPDGSVLVVLDPPGLIHQALQTGRSTAAPAPDHPDRPRHRILVVDDALTVRELQRSILERAGFAVRVASDGSQALTKLAEEPSDLVLTDIEMPTMDGFALTEAIRVHPSLANTPVLILSSRSSDADRQRGLDAGADGYIAKSGFDEAGLLTAVNRLLGARA